MSGSTSSGIVSRCSGFSVVFGEGGALRPWKRVSGGVPSLLIFRSGSLGFGGFGGRFSRGQSSCLSGYMTIAMCAKASISSSSVISGWKRLGKDTLALLTFALS